MWVLGLESPGLGVNHSSHTDQSGNPGKSTFLGPTWLIYQRLEKEIP